MKRFLKILALLIVGLLLLVSGLDAALDRLTHATIENSFTQYGEKGEIIVAYNGDLALTPALIKPVPSQVPFAQTRFLHRTSGSGALPFSPIASTSGNGWD